jgi:hypothetical protein
VVAKLQDYRCSDGHPENGRGKVVLRKGGHIAYPGGVDDWMHLLNDGYRMTGTANSDSHGSYEEIGSPRTYVRIARLGQSARDQHPNAVSDLDIVEALKGQRALMTNGPFFDMHVQAGGELSPVGSLVTVPAGESGAQVNVTFTLRTANWVSVDEIVLFANGEVVERLAVPSVADLVARDQTFSVTLTVQKDTVLVAEAYGSRNLFPMVSANEELFLSVASLLGGLGSSLGGLASFEQGDGIKAPTVLQKITPYAITNPIWVDVNGNGEFDPPGNLPGPGAAPDEACPEASTASEADSLGRALYSDDSGRDLRPIMPYGPSRAGRWDIRKLFIGHGHDH